MNQKIQLYKATHSLDVKYSFNYAPYEDAEIILPGSLIHEMLFSGCNDFLQKEKEIYGERKDIKKINFATAALTLFGTDTTTDEGCLGDEVDKIITLDILTHKKNRILTSKVFYNRPYQIEGVVGNKALRCYDFNDSLAKRVDAFSRISRKYILPKGTVSTTESLESVIESGTFHERFHHSEQGIMHYLSSREGIKAIVKKALSTGISYLYGMVLDIYTQRSLCCNCNTCLLGTQNSYEDGFLFDLSQALESKRIESRENGLMLNTRVSLGTYDKKHAPRVKPNDRNLIHLYNPDLDNKIFQSENNQLKSKKNPKISLGDYEGAFFSSRKFSNKNLQNQYSEIKPSHPHYLG